MTEHDWLTGDAVAIGRHLLAHLPPAAQVARACAVLAVCRAELPAVAEVEHVAALGAEPARWREAHAAFSAVRTQTLAEEHARADEPRRMLLYVAEIVAKTIYNASGAPAPFDDDSAWWLARTAREPHQRPRRRQGERHVLPALRRRLHDVGAPHQFEAGRAVACRKPDSGSANIKIRAVPIRSYS